MECPECNTDSLEIWYDDDELQEQGAYTLICHSCRHEMYVPAEATARSRIAKLRSIVREHSAKRVDGYIVDAFTAGMLCKVYDALSKENKEKFGKVSLPKLVDFGWRCVK